MATQARGGRKVILDAAIQLYEQVGFHGASIRDIAAGADVTPASIYYHFKSKQQILQEIMIGILTDVIAETRAAILAAGNDPRDQLAALVHTWVTFHIERQSESSIGNSEIRSLDADGRRRIVALRDEQERIFESVVDRGVSEGAFRTEFPRDASRAVLNMGRSVVNWYRLGGEITPDELARRYADLALGTVRAVDV